MPWTPHTSRPCRTRAAEAAVDTCLKQPCHRLVQTIQACRTRAAEPLCRCLGSAKAAAHETLKPLRLFLSEEPSLPLLDAATSRQQLHRSGLLAVPPTQWRHTRHPADNVAPLSCSSSFEVNPCCMPDATQEHHWGLPQAGKLCSQAAVCPTTLRRSVLDAN